jgi:hypothetical protein
MKIGFVVFLATVVVGIAVWASFQPSLVDKNIDNSIEVNAFEKPKDFKFKVSKKDVVFENVSFTYETDSFSEIKSEIVQAQPLIDEMHKPDYVNPRHINFSLRSVRTDILQDFDAAIRIYPIEGLIQAYSVSKESVKGLKSEINRLDKILGKKTKLATALKPELPYLEFVDASQLFHARAKVVRFQNGTGLLFLTQFLNEGYAHVINNERLEYAFQGLTDDKKYLVSMTFSVSVKGFPSSDMDDTHGDYKIPDTLLPNKSYDEYVLKIARELDKMPSQKFTPNLNKIENLIHSLKIK